MRSLLFAFLLSTTAAFAAEPNTLTAEEQAAGWKLLFDGKTTAGWRSVKQAEFPAKGWVVEEGTLKHVAKGGGGDIVSIEEFENFEFVWDWKLPTKANSGLKYNLPNPKVGLGCEYQMLDDTTHPEGKSGTHKTGSLYDLVATAPETKPSPVGEWNSSKLIVNGNKVEHWLNGTKVLAYEFGSDELKALIAKSKYKGAAGFGIKTKSPLLLQDHGDEVAVRNVKIRVLK